MPELSIWEQEGRLVCALLSFHPSLFCLISIYGHPPSHPKHANNEVMFQQVGAWMMSLKMPAVAMGDWNETVDSSPLLSLLPFAGLWKINSSSPTTHGKLRCLTWIGD